MLDLKVKELFLYLDSKGEVGLSGEIILPNQPMVGVLSIFGTTPTLVLKFRFVFTDRVLHSAYIGVSGTYELEIVEGLLLELRSISFGLAFGGNVAIINADVRIDDYNLVSLAASLLLPEHHGLPPPDPHDLQRRLIIDDLFMLIGWILRKSGAISVG